MVGSGREAGRAVAQRQRAPAEYNSAERNSNTISE
jgi:hypothetical protein